MVFIKFVHKFDNYNPGDVAHIERTLALRLIGLGIAARGKSDSAAVPVEPVKEPIVAEPPDEGDPKPEKPKPTKKKPFRRAKKIEKAVEVEKQ